MRQHWHVNGTACLNPISTTCKTNATKVYTDEVCNKIRYSLLDDPVEYSGPGITQFVDETFIQIFACENFCPDTIFEEEPESPLWKSS